MIAVAVIAAFFVLLVSVRGIANQITDYLWFDAAGYRSVWAGVLSAKVLLGVFFTVLFFVLCWANLWLADRLSPEYREASPEEEAIARVRQVIGERWGQIRAAVSVVFALSLGAGASVQWKNWILFRNAGDFGEVDAHFGQDIGFFVFRMPFLTWLIGWLFTAVLVVLVLTVGMHYLGGGIRIQSLTERVTPQVKGHISMLLAALALIRAAEYWLDRFALAYSFDGKFAGLSYTDATARLPIKSLLILIALLSTVLFIINIRRRGWGLPVVAVGLWALVSIVMNGIYPLVVQRFSVDPDETTKEAQYIARNIAATKDAYGLGPVDQRRFFYEEDLSGADLQGNADNLSSVPLLTPEVTASTFALQQVERTFFKFDTEADVDRYVIDGVNTQVLLNTRELNGAELSDSGWESEVLTFTHGNGIALAPINTIEESLPVFLIGDLPQDNQIEDDIPIDQPRVYYGETMDGYAIVNTARDEVDSIEGSRRLAHNYHGEGGVKAGGFWRRALFSLRFQSIDPLISDFIRDDSRFIWHRNINERVSKVAPFLELDHNPYPVIIDGRVKFVVDGFTTSRYFPYAQPRDASDLTPSSDLRAGYNYVRNSVKATVDAYDGTVSLYIVDDTDPLIAAYDRAFPGVLLSSDEIPEALIDNFRYPEDLFTVQTNMWSTYHIDSDETADLIERSDEWSIAQDPGGVEGADQTRIFNPDGTTTSSEVRVDPYYTLLRLPGENEKEFVILRSFVPFSNDDAVKELQAFMVGVSEFTDASYGRLVSYEIDNSFGDEEAPGPALVASQIASQERISERISLLNAKNEGSSVKFGDLIVLPVEDSLVYVRPLYVVAASTEQPNLEWVIVAHADKVVMCHGLANAIEALFGVKIDGLQQAEDDSSECIGDVISRSSVSTIADTTTRASQVVIQDGSALNEAARLLEAAKAALRGGDLGEYQAYVEAASTVLNQAVETE